MIEVMSYPPDLSTWDPAQQPFYLEVFGETRPVLDTQFAEVVPAGPLDAAAQTTQVAPIYEYWWTIGYPGHPHSRSQAPQWFRNTFAGHEDFWQKVEDPAGRVYLYFPTHAGWRIKELVATLKYLNPTVEQKTLWSAAAEQWKVASPILANAGTVAGTLTGMPWLGAAAGGASSALQALAKLEINNIPQADGFEWSVAKVTFPSPSGGMQGVTWRLPKRVFTDLGGRITGSLAVSFIPTIRQLRNQVTEAKPAPQVASLQAHAVVYGPDQTHYWAPGKEDFIELALEPQLPLEAVAGSGSKA